MIANRSVPASTVLPHLVYEDIEEAVAWLTRAFGFREHYRYGEPADGAQMRLGEAWVMLSKAREDRKTPAQAGTWTQDLTIFVEDVEAHYANAKAAGAKIVEELHETMYGELQYGVADLAGHHWLFSRHARDADPASWGARVAEPAVLPPAIAPMLAVSDGSAAVAFYRAAFDATVLWQLGTGVDIVAGLEVHGAKFFLAHEAPPYGTRGPAGAGFTTVRIELFTDDPAAVHKQALAAGARERSPVQEYEYSMEGPRPIRRMLQGGVTDPFGHLWLIGKVIG